MIEVVLKYLAIILSSLELSITSNGLRCLGSIVVNYIDELFLSVKLLMNLQRRVHPGYIDMALVFKAFDIQPRELFYQLQCSKVIRQSLYLNDIKIVDLQAKQILEEYGQKSAEDKLDLNDKDYSETVALIPSTYKKKFYIQNFVPDFPPDHTYRYTSVFTKKVEDPKELRQVLVNEGNAALKNLLNLQLKITGTQPIELLKEGKQEDHAAAGELTKDNQSDQEDPITKINIDKLEELPGEKAELDGQKALVVYNHEEGQNGPEDTKIEPVRDDGAINTNLPSKPLDIVEYANKRLGIKKRKLERQHGATEKLRQDKSYANYIEIGKYLSSYVPNENEQKGKYDIKESLGGLVANTLSSSYNSLLASLKQQRKAKQQRHLKRLEIKKERDRLRDIKRKELDELKSQREKDLNEIDFENFDFGFDDDEEEMVVDLNELNADENKTEEQISVETGQVDNLNENEGEGSGQVTLVSSAREEFLANFDSKSSDEESLDDIIIENENIEEIKQESTQEHIPKLKVKFSIPESREQEIQESTATENTEVVKISMDEVDLGSEEDEDFDNLLEEV